MDKANLKEHVQHGTVQFPVALYLCGLPNENLLVPYHWHEEIELIFIEKGDIDLNINMKNISCKTDTFYFINREELHFLKSNSPCFETAVVFDLKFLSFEMFDVVQSNIINPLLKKQLKFPLSIERNSAFGELIYEEFKKIIQAFSECRNSQYIVIKSALLNILAILADYELFIKEEDLGVKNSKSNIMMIKSIISFIKVNYKKKIYIKELAELVNMNEQYFCRFFKRAIGHPPMTYLNIYRIEKASQLLQESEAKIIDISFECGYENIGYFIKMFKKFKGCTPSEYRKVKIV